MGSKTTVIPQSISQLTDIDDVPATEAAGTLIYSDGTDWQSLALGASGQYLKAGAAAPEWGALASTLQLVATVTLTVAGTSIDFQNLNYVTDGYYIIVFSVTNDGTGGDLFLDFNGDTTATNYYRQRVSGSAATVDANRGNTNTISQIVAANQEYSGHYKVFRSGDGYATAVGQTTNRTDSSIFLDNITVCKTSATVANITRLTIRSDQNMSVGSTASVYKVPRA